ncbi:cell division protein FtsQ/DivIB [Thiolapillus sp.]
MKGKKSNSLIRRWRLWLLAGFAAASGAGFYALAGYLMNPQVLPIRSIQIKNEFRNLDKVGLQQALLKAIDGGFFSVDLHQLRAAALSAAWVAEARVTRVWPDKLVVEVVEQTPIASWGKDALLNANGEVFRPQRKPDKQLPLRFNGDEDKAELMLDFFVREQRAFRKHGMSIREVDLDKRGEWRLKLTDGTTIVVGKEQMNKRIKRLLGVYAVLEQAQRKPLRVDLRYEQGFAVSWRSEEKG